MRAFRYIWVLLRHAVLVWRTGQLRFRLETFGLYYPSPPYRAPWWRVSPRVAWLLLAGIGAYARWLVEMEELRRGGPARWWLSRAGVTGVAREQPD